MGSGLAQSLARAGYPVLLAHDGEEDLSPSLEKLPSLLARINLRMPKANVGIVTSPREASWEADIIIPVVPYEAQSEIALNIKDVVTGKVVISVTNPLNEACDGILTAPTTSAAEELAQYLPHSKIVKAFSTIYPAHFEMPIAAGKRVDVFVAGDDEGAVSMVMQLVRDAGFNPILAGNLATSRTLESMMVLLVGLSARNHYSGLAGWKVVHESAEQREQSDLNVFLGQAAGKPTPREAKKSRRLPGGKHGQ
jgi:hypothetical protein